MSRTHSETIIVDEDSTGNVRSIRLQEGEPERLDVRLIGGPADGIDRTRWEWDWRNEVWRRKSK